MSEEDPRKRWEDRAHKPFEPIFASLGKGIDTSAALRMAHAFEYIAAQLGQINRSSGSSLADAWHDQRMDGGVHD